MASVTYLNATRYYKGSSQPAVDHLNLCIDDGEFLVLVGPSGCGKTTTLRMLAGLEEVNEGSIHIGTTDVTNIAPGKRDIAMVFQNYALYPHMTVAENIGFHLKITKTPKAEMKQRISEVAKMLDLTDFLDRKPAMLSGGQRQRVAMGRAIIRSPQVFLMDEPLSNLDAKLRVQTRTNIAELQRSLGTTTVYVTHDQVEAMTMGHRVAILNAGTLQQVDTPATLYREPCNIFVAGFIGSPAMNLIQATVIDGQASLSGITHPLTPQIINELTDNTIIMGIRPENIRILGTATQHDSLTDPPHLSVTVEAIEELGADSYLYCTGKFTTIHPDTGKPDPKQHSSIALRAPGLSGIRIGHKLQLTWEPTHTLFFHPHTGKRLL